MDIKTNYIIIGDSIIYGIGDKESGGWPARFKKFVVNKDDTKVCSNYVHIAGFSGATSTNILSKINSIIDSFGFEDANNVVILSIGVNDTQEFNGQSKNNIFQYSENIKNIIKKVLDKNCNLIILGLTRIQSDEKFYWKPNKYYDNLVIAKYDMELFNICKSFNIKYISMQDVLDKNDFVDGLHPNSLGHNKMFNEVVKNLKLDI